MNASNIIENVLSASIRYLEAKGFEVLEQTERGETPYIVLRDDEDIAVAKVQACEGGFPEDGYGREEFEDVAMSFLADHVGPDTRVRPDLVQVCIIADNRALLRHTINAPLAECAA